MTDSARRVFVSHIHEERALGDVIKTWIEDAFAGHDVEAFLSSDRQSLPTGRKWRDVILDQLSTTKIMVSVLSPASLARPWPNIELGAAWVRDLRIIPLCHSGQTFGALPPPFSDFHGTGLDENDAAQRLLGGVADGFGLKLPTRLDFAACRRELIAAAAKSEGTPARPQAATIGGDELPPEQAALLIIAAQVLNIATRQDDDHIPAEQIATYAKLSLAVATYHLHELVEAELLYALHYSGGPYYKLSPAGAGWLIKHGKMPAPDG